MTYQGLISKIFKQLIQLDNRKRNNSIKILKNWQKTSVDISSKKTYRWPIGTWKDFNMTNHYRNANQNYNITLIRMAIIKKSTNNKRWRGCREKRILLHCCLEYKLMHYGKKYGSSLKKTKNKVSIWSNHSTARHISRKDENSNLKNTRIPVFIVALFAIAEMWKQLKCPLTGKQIKKMWYMYIKEY